MRVIPHEDLIGRPPPPGSVYLSARDGSVSAALFVSRRQAAAEQRATPLRDPILKYRISTLRCGNLVILYRPKTRGEAIARGVRQALP